MSVLLLCVAGFFFTSLMFYLNHRFALTPEQTWAGCGRQLIWMEMIELLMEQLIWERMKRYRKFQLSVISYQLSVFYFSF